MSYLRMAVLFILALAAHWLWSAYFSFLGLAPQILLVLTVIAAARQGSITGMCLGFAWGLFLDVFQPHLFGANALVLTLIGYAVGAVRRQIDVAGFGPLCALVLSMTWGYFVLTGILGLIFMKSFFWVGWRPFLFDPLYNCALIAPLFLIWESFTRDS